MRQNIWAEDLQDIFVEPVQRALALMDTNTRNRIDELRLRAHRPVMAQCGNEDWFVGADGSVAGGAWEKRRAHRPEHTNHAAPGMRALALCLRTRAEPGIHHRERGGTASACPAR